MNAINRQMHKLLEQATSLKERSSGELAKELLGRLQKDTAIRITAKGVRVTHSKYIDRLTDASAIDAALAQEA